MQANRRGLTDIFSRARYLEIPFFQRAYVWTAENWDRFLEDLLRVAQERKDYFLGSVILKQKRTAATGRIGDVRIVIDGQQRLTTLVLFFRVLFDAIDQEAEFRSYFMSAEGRPIVRHNHADIEVFEAIVGGRLTDEVRADHADNGVLKAYDFFREHAERIAEVDPLALFTHLYVVGMDLDEGEDEQQIFDTINSLGVSLTTAELLKNELFDQNDRELYRHRWHPAFEAEGATRAYWATRVTSGRTRRENIDLFLQSFLSLRPDAPDDVRVDQLFGAYRELIAAHVPQRDVFVEQLCGAAHIYRDHFDVGTLDQEVLPEDAVGRLNLIVFGLNITTFVPYVLFVLLNVADDAERGAILGLIESYVMRRLVCKGTTKAYNRLFQRLVRERVLDARRLGAELRANPDGEARFPKDEELRRGFQESNLSNAQARLVLYLIESSIRDRRNQSTTLSGLRHYSLEHLMPKKWVNEWGQLSKERAHNRDQVLRKLGNLALLSTSLNTTIRDASWPKKKEGTSKRPGLKIYAAGLETLAPWLEKEDWSEREIAERGRWLAEKAKIVWAYPAPAQQAPDRAPDQ